MAVSAEHAIVCTLKPTLVVGQNYFSILGVEPSFEVDLNALAAHYRQLQQTIHPDRFMHECERSQRLAQQQAAQVNEAYNTLKSPLLRAQYLMELAGQQHVLERTVRDADFLFEQMLLRERLDEAASNLTALEYLQTDVQQAAKQYQDSFAAAWQKQEWPAAQQAIDKLQFANKLLHEIEERQERLLDE